MNIASLTTQTPVRPAASKPMKEVDFSYNPQDQVVLDPGTTRVKVGDDLSNGKIQLVGGLQPNLEGSYVYDRHDARFHGANAFAAVAKTQALFEEAYGQPIAWATGKPQLEVHADNGNVLNAFYSRDDGGLFFFHSTDPVTQRVVHGADSGEVTGHECGHAILDAIRPGYMSSWSGDAGGFHESFGDVVAMLVSLQDPRVLDKVAEQTGGDMKKPNMAAALGEELGITINHTAGKNATGGDYTRNAINHFTWKKPSSLPHTAPPEQLSTEPHSWSRLWTGAVYDVFSDMVQQNLAGQPNVAAAISQAANELLGMYGRLMKMAPKGSFTYKQMAAAFIQSDLELNQGKRAGQLSKAFAARKILEPKEFRADSSAPENSRTQSVFLSNDATHNFGVFAGARVETDVSDRFPQAAEDLKDRLAVLVAAGEIKYTEPGQKLTQQDLIKSNGAPYTGVVRWFDGEMTIERVKILS
ncbi:hypothetical protein IV102_31855 [bacterium]|nr:hypothetical protein [bacterium]